MELEDLERRMDDLEAGPERRGLEYTKNMFKLQDSSAGKVFLTMFQIWFEMRATEDEKRIIWKKIQQAKKDGRLLDISEFGESDGLSWKNLLSSTESHDN